MKYRRLGHTDLAISEIGFGCGPTAGLMIRGTPEERRDAIAHALERGINYFDTAPVYGGTVSEVNLGHAFRDLGVEPIVATKVALSFDELSDIGGAVIRSVEASLARLGVERLALVQLHNRVGPHRAPRPDIGSGALLTVDDVLGRDGVVAALKTLRERGLVGSFGCCAFGGETAAVDRLIESGEFAAILVHYSVLNPSALARRTPPTTLRDYAQIGERAASAAMGVIALRVLEGGTLAGTVRHKLAGAPIGTDAAIGGHVKALRQLVGGTQDLTETAIRFALSNVAVSTALIGFSDVAQIDHAVACAERGPLDPLVAARIEALDAAADIG
jgi:aryl-alcohol dehydrogenase-like predicted oxidoreductase